MRSGPWLAGMDFPFGQPRKLIENLGWPDTWAGYVRQVSELGRQGFVDALKTYRDGRAVGDKHHLRHTDILAKSCSPMMLYGVPVGKMFFEGAPRLLKSGVSVQPVHVQNDSCTVIEAYPALVVRHWIGSRSYKNDAKAKQTPTLRSAREELVRGLLTPNIREYFGFEVNFDAEYAEAFIHDSSGDQIDALLCAIQAGWHTHSARGIMAFLWIAIQLKAGSWTQRCSKRILSNAIAQKRINVISKIQLLNIDIFKKGW
jgi:hypothetical protein